MFNNLLTILFDCKKIAGSAMFLFFQTKSERLAHFFYYSTIRNTNVLVEWPFLEASRNNKFSANKSKKEEKACVSLLIKCFETG